MNQNDYVKSFYVVYQNQKIVAISSNFFLLFNCFKSLDDFLETHKDIQELFTFEQISRKYYKQDNGLKSYWFEPLLSTQSNKQNNQSRIIFTYKGKKYCYEVFISNGYSNPNEFTLYFNPLHNQLKNEKRFINFYHRTQSKIRKLEKLSKHKDKLSLMGEMMENITHQWKQPLTNILFVATSIQLQRSLEMLSDEELDKSLENIVQAVNYMSQTVNDFKNFLNEEKQKRVFKISEIIDKIESIIKGNIKRHSIDLMITSNNHLYSYGFENELIQSVINIINNAVDALKVKNPMDRKIDITLFQRDSYSIIKIEDNAGGIPSEIIDKIFEHYFTTKGENGSGIGLHMTQDIIHNHFHGELKVYNSELGAVFEIILPLYVFEEITELTII